METPRPPLLTCPHNHKPIQIYDALDQNMTDDCSYTTGDLVFISVIAIIVIPIVCLVIYAVYSLIKSNEAAPVLVINLLISDLVLFVSMSVLQIVCFNYLEFILLFTLTWACVSGLCFRAYVAVERYALIAHPVWHDSHHAVKCLSYSSLIGWLLPLIVPFWNMTGVVAHCVSFLLYAVIIVCFVSTCMSLFHSTSLKRSVLASILLMLISFTLNLPLLIVLFLDNLPDEFSHVLYKFIFLFYVLNPLVDCMLYVFIRCDAENKPHETFSDVHSDRV